MSGFLGRKPASPRRRSCFVLDSAYESSGDDARHGALAASELLGDGLSGVGWIWGRRTLCVLITHCRITT